MKKRKSTPAKSTRRPASPAKARDKRVNACESELAAALKRILKKHRCRLSIRQVWVDGHPGPVSLAPEPIPE